MLVGASTVSSGFERFVVAILGLIYVSIDYGLTVLHQNQADSAIANHIFSIETLKASGDEYVKNNYSNLQQQIRTFEEASRTNNKALIITKVSSVVIILICLLLVYSASNA